MAPETSAPEHRVERFGTELGDQVFGPELGSLVGRRRELDELEQLVGTRRLVTLAGPGGAGKTRVARELVLRRAAAGDAQVGWADLSSVSDPGRVAEVVASSMGVLVGPWVEPIAALAVQMRDRRAFICLDSCEHLRHECARLVSTLLQLCPDVSMLATSRVPLDARGETVWRLPPMSEQELLMLFAARAASASPGFEVDAGNEEAIRAICRRVDGIPLAIELAAAWVRVLSPDQIAAQLDHRLELLTGGPTTDAERHRTMVASVQWSYDLLASEARTLLQRCSVFRGGFSLDAAMAVCATSEYPTELVLRALRQLVDASMLEVDSDDGCHRYRLLEIIRSFAADRLDEIGDAGATRDRHAAHFLAVAERGAREIEVGDLDVALKELEQDHDNLRGARDWNSSRSDPSAFRRLCVAMTGLWLLRGHAAEGFAAVQRCLDAAPRERSPLQSQLWAALALLAMPAGRIELIGTAAEQALEIATEAADDAALARAHLAGCYLAFYCDYERAHDLATAAQAHGNASGDQFSVELGLMFEMVSLGNRDRYSESLVLAEQLLAASEPRHNRFAMTIARIQQMNGAILTGDVRAGIEFGRAAVSSAEPLHDYFIAGTATSNLAWALAIGGHLDEATALLDALVRSVGYAGPDVDVVDIVVNVGDLHLWSGQPAIAVEWLERASSFSDPGADNWSAARALPELAAALRELGRHDDAQSAAELGLGMARRLGTPHLQARALDEIAHLSVDTDPSRALDLHHQALTVRVNHNLRTHLADSLDHLAGLSRLFGEHQEAARLFAASDCARDVSGYPRPKLADTRYRASLDALASALGDTGFRDARVEGGSLGVDDAVAYATRARGPRGRPATGWASLSPTEHKVAMLVAEGMTNPQIGTRLFMSRATVKSHLAHIFTKLGIRTRAELAAHAARHPSP